MPPANNSSPAVARNPFAEVDDSDEEEGYYDEDIGDDDDDDDDMAPLMESSSHWGSPSNRRAAFEMEQGGSYRDDEMYSKIHPRRRDSSAGNPAKYIVSIVLTAMILIPFVVSSSSRKTGRNPFYLPDDADCHSQQSFDLFLEAMQKRSSQADFFCRDKSNDETCSCPPPTVPKATNSKYMDFIQSHVVDKNTSSVDVLFMGSTMMEHWSGTDQGIGKPEFESIGIEYKKLFTKQEGGQLEGAMLAFSGLRLVDQLHILKETNVLDGLNPKVLWLAMGDEELGDDDCTVDAVLASTIALVDAFLSQRTSRKSRVVISSLLAPPALNATAGDSETSLWNSVGQTNDRLLCFAESKDKFIYYFNTTSVFGVEGKNTETVYWIELSEDRKYYTLTPEGYAEWGLAIEERLLEIIGR